MLVFILIVIFPLYIVYIVNFNNLFTNISDIFEKICIYADGIIAVVTCVYALATIVAVSFAAAAFNESKKMRYANFRSRIIIDIMHRDHKLYMYVRNIGTVDAFDMSIKFSDDKIRNPVRNLKYLSVGATFRYFLLDPRTISEYENLHDLVIDVYYYDVYGKRHDELTFPLLDILEYNCELDEKTGYYDMYNI